MPLKKPAIGLILCLLVLTVPGAALAANDPRFPQQWGLHRIQAEPAWGPGNGGGAVTIAVVDTGVNFGHEDLMGKSAGSFDCIKNSPAESEGCSPEGGEDVNGHGTEVAGVAAAAANNGRGVASVAPSANILSLRVLDKAGEGYLRDVARAIRFAAGRARVINLSLGPEVGLVGLVGNVFDSTFQDAINFAALRGSSVVAASGNGFLASSYSGMENVLVVGASRADDSRSIYSDSAEILAPGGSEDCPGSTDRCIVTTANNGGYTDVAGTSFAAPHVSGVAALLISQAAGRSPADVRNIILGTADQVSGGSRVNAARAVGAPIPVSGGGPRTSGGEETSGPDQVVVSRTDGTTSSAAAAAAAAKKAASVAAKPAAPAGAPGSPGSTPGTLVLGAAQGEAPSVSESVAGRAEGSGSSGRARRISKGGGEDSGSPLRKAVVGLGVLAVAGAGGAFFWKRRVLG